MMNDMELVKLALSDSESSTEARGELLDRCKDVLSYHIVKYKNMYYGKLNHFDIEDLISECHVAVLESIKLYDPDKHKSSGFSNFAKFVIRNRILNMLRDNYVAPSKVMDFSVDVNTVNIAAPEPYKERRLTVRDDTSEKNKLIIAMVLDGYTQVEVAKKFNLTKGRINHIIKKYVKAEEE